MPCPSLSFFLSLHSLPHPVLALVALSSMQPSLRPSPAVHPSHLFSSSVRPREGGGSVQIPLRQGERRRADSLTGRAAELQPCLADPESRLMLVFRESADGEARLVKLRSSVRLSAVFIPTERASLTGSLPLLSTSLSAFGAARGRHQGVQFFFHLRAGRPALALVDAGAWSERPCRGPRRGV